jgi:hypothetical protein
VVATREARPEEVRGGTEVNDIEKALTPKANELGENVAKLASAPCYKSNRHARRNYASIYRQYVREQLEDEAAKLGLGVGFFASMLLRWAISKLVKKIMERWLNAS